jgi:hypothetical protein
VGIDEDGKGQMLYGKNQSNTADGMDESMEQAKANPTTNIDI